MKTVPDWIADPKTRFLKCQTAELRAVQLDAIKHGMKLAADIAEQAGYFRTPKGVKQKILHDAHLYELPPA